MPLQLLGKSVEELRALAASWGEPAYRGDQIYHALYAERIFDFAQMTTLSAKLRERLASECEIRIAANREALSLERMVPSDIC